MQTLRWSFFIWNSWLRYLVGHALQNGWNHFAAKKNQKLWQSIFCDAKQSGSLPKQNENYYILVGLLIYQSSIIFCFSSCINHSINNISSHNVKELIVCHFMYFYRYSTCPKLVQKIIWHDIHVLHDDSNTFLKNITVMSFLNQRKVTYALFNDMALLNTRTI